MTSRPQALLFRFQRWRRDALFAACDRGAVLAHVDEAGELAPRYAFMTLLSAGIAMLGLLQGSGAVIIGAMLISPLMGPIVEMGMALATFDFRTLRAALKTMTIGVALALAISYAIVAISPLQEPTSEILARTQPTLFDLLVAIFSGLAGAYATITRKGETIVGVAIATALMPPLAVVGYGIAVGNASIAGGAAFLFMTNLLAIALSVTIMARWYGFGRGDTPKQTALQAALIVAAFLLLSVPLALALRTIAARSVVEHTVRAALDEAAGSGGGRITTLRVEHGVDGVAVDAVLLTPRHRAQLEQSLEASLQHQLSRPVRVELREVLTADDASVAQQQSSLAQLRNSVAQLQTVAAQDAEQRVAKDQAEADTLRRAVAALGTLEPARTGVAETWRLRGDAGIGIEAARRLESRLRSQPGTATLRVVPAVQALPLIGFADDSSTIDTDAESRLRDIAWALSRWQTDVVRVSGYAGRDGALAGARAETIRGWLAGNGVQVAETSTGSPEASRALVQRHGEDGLRVARIDVGAAP